MVMRNAGERHYEFSAAPQVQKPKTKYRELTQQEAPQPMIDATNIMWDRRVVRGNTYAAIVTTSREVAQQQARSVQPRPKNIAKPLEDAEVENFQNDASTPRAVEGRKHINVYTDENVELLTDKPPKYERDAQTDFIIDRPVNRLYMPVKTGEDRETQIWDGELFNFDYEVEPILQVLMGKTLEQGRMEVLEEEELRVMKEEQKRYDELRYAEIAEAQRMEAEERKKLEENEKRKKQHKAKKDQNVLCHQKLMSRILAKEYLKNVNNTSLRILQEQGSFQNHFDYEFNHAILPWFFRDILHLQEGQTAGANTIRGIIAETMRNSMSIHEKAVYDEMERRRINQEERERIAQETKERRAKRAEARNKRAEEERKRLLQEKISEILLSKGEQKPQMFAQILSDLDSYGKEGLTVGLPGGIIGEILLILSTLDEFKRAPADDPLSSLKTIEVTKDTIQKILDYIVVEIIKDGKIEVGFTGEIEAQLEGMDPELNLETLHTKPAKANDIRALLKSSINSFVLSVIQENAEELGIRKDYIELIINGIVNLLVHTDEKGRKIKLVKAPLDYSQDTRFEALAITLPNPDELALFNLAEAKGVKQQPKKGRKPSKKESISNIEDSLKTEEGEAIAVNPAEVDFEDAVSVFPLSTEELRILTHQKAVSIVLRREILIFLTSIFKDLDMKELEVLKRVNTKSDGIEAVVSRKFAKTLDVITFDKV